LKLNADQPIFPGRGTIVGRAAMTRQVARIADAWTDPLYEKKEDAKIGMLRSMIGVPLMRKSEPIGVIGLSRSRVDPFSDRDIELVMTFANQAVIAIENVRPFEAEQQRTRDLTEALEQQTAASEVLQVISRSEGELEPVFAFMLEQAVCGSATPRLEISTAGMVRPCTSWQHITRRAPLPRNAGVHPIVPIQNLLSAKWSL
jgi:GAF domain-containing protein